MTISALQALHLTRLAELPDSLAALFVEDVAYILAHFVCKLLILLNLLLCVPEPLVDLLLLESYVGGEL